MALAISEKYELTAQTSSLETSGNSVFTAGKQLYMGSDLDLDIVSGATTTIVGTTKIDLNP
jgi:hypothetical protein